MPNVKSAKKRVRQTAKRRLRNKSYKTRVKNSIKKVLAAVEAKKEREEVLELLNNAFSVIDKAAKKGVIHKNNAARKKARIHRKVKELLGEVQ
ncbi:30S ribosomal protein S20 [Marinitoga sp. 1135]|uniref:Small ribosomal subunit protein bS20 n=1 Tax=Marinitoga piezophila (strain DSM 14283 / JCM 11233 / KA3) TaxID=443254 RepID=H2J816_MARPK|nr:MULTISPECIES: 30S ribosomal protein S20 [Marinitoga]AEX85507.1 ribosomal protein S20 [Marinitoga piezophila KA3]APT75976.1 30S ribosomal protein S20 [Marinitoga sp. 1137]NUU95716.1 30S ribosomal protein S20 [Marinitoga sp. 1135]NUU97648.1 30S ribosomal protein S20 [Marinitoga sp. 1138]